MIEYMLQSTLMHCMYCMHVEPCLRCRGKVSSQSSRDVSREEMERGLEIISFSSGETCSIV